MHLRPFQRGDISQIADIGATVFVDDPRVSWLCPRAQEYPAQFRANIVERIRRRFVQEQVWGMVCVSDQRDVSSASGTPCIEEQVVGYAIWERCESSDTTIAPENSDAPRSNADIVAAFERVLLKVQDRYEDLFELNRAKDYKRQATARNGSLLKGPSVKLPSHWFLAGLAVHSSWQRKGIGQRLLQWGLDRAESEHLPVVLSSTPEGLGLYKKNGFRVVDALGLPENLPAEPFLIWDPARRWIRELEPSDVSERYSIPVEVAWTSELCEA